MASVVTFWQMPDEEDHLFRHLAKREDACAIPFSEAVTDPSLIIAMPMESLVGRCASNRLYLTLREFAKVPPLHAWAPDDRNERTRYSLPMSFPAIVYDAGTLADGRLSQSNVSAYSSVWDEAAKASRSMPEGFVKWMRRVMGWLRRATPDWHEYESYRVSKKAAQAAMNGLVLVPYHGWSGNSTGRSSFKHVR